MKYKFYFSPFIMLLFLAFSGCKKDPVTKPVKFTATKYETIGYDFTGKPNYLLKDTISAELLSFIKSTLPNEKNLTVSNPQLFTNTAIADIAITKSSDVFITFVAQDGGNRNSIAYYIYPTNNPPTSSKDISLITYVFPSAGYKTPLLAGDKVKIGKFEAGTSIGFVLMENAWNSTTQELNNRAVHFCSNDALNPEVDPKLKKHAVLIKYIPDGKILIGFEDTDRTSSQCDNDFNDVIVYGTVTGSHN
ncbi:MAG: DUF4114 domain-containing protein [Ginsengibacter sp.]